MMRRPVLSIALLAIGSFTTARAGLVPLQLGPASPCSAVIDLGVATPTPELKENGRPLEHSRWSLSCADGDPACDADGAADGKCDFSVRLCVAQAMSRCRPDIVTSVRFRSSPLYRYSRPAPGLPELGSAAPACGTGASFSLALRPHRTQPASRSFPWVGRLSVRSEKRGGDPGPSSRATVVVRCVPPPASTAGAFLE